MFFQYDDKSIDYLSAQDATLGNAIKRIGHIKRAVNNDIFSSIIHHIVGQQISTVAQETLWRRLEEGLGSINAHSLCNCNRDELQAYGLSFRKVDYIQDFAQKVRDGELILDAFTHMPDKDVIDTLCRLKGIGVWTAEMLLLFCLQRPDVVSFGDLAIIRGMRMLYGHENIDKKLFDTYARTYSPHGSVASLYLWAIAGGALPDLHDPAPALKERKTKKKEQKSQEEKVAYYQCPYGLMRVLYTDTHILSLKRCAEEKSEKPALPPHVRALFTQLDEYFAGKRQNFELPLQLHGTDFQKSVWQALCDIPYGETRSYQEIAQAIGNIKACRAVGLANNKNPISIIVPCHRVVGKSGKLVGYAGGLEMKEGLLNLERKTRF